LFFSDVVLASPDVFVIEWKVWPYSASGFAEPLLDVAIVNLGSHEANGTLLQFVCGHELPVKLHAATEQAISQRPTAASISSVHSSTPP
jgi:hypothetical protein